ncbi:MAG TPA: septum formation initiator family protein [Acetobacteraceae bacterium]|nr:septum formation initiator family protein [Acetobacteraceae bacterium]
MAFGREVKRRIRAAVAPLVFLSLVSYFGWSATRGDHGLVAYAQRQQLLHQAQDELTRVQADRTEWERRVSALRSDRLDADMLDERARAMLNLSDPADIIVAYGDKDRLY